MIYVDVDVTGIDGDVIEKINKILKTGFKYNKQGVLSAAAWMMLKYALENEYGIRLGDLDIKLGEFGKPFINNLEGIEFNLSHSHNAVAAALSRKPVGVDLQKILEYKEDLAKRVCNDEELLWLEKTESKAEAFYSIWTMKESYVKYTGFGMTGGFKHIPYKQYAKTYKLNDEYVMSVCCEEDLEIRDINTCQYICI